MAKKKKKWGLFKVEKEDVKEERDDVLESFKDFFTVKTIIGVILSIITFIIFYDSISTLILALSHLIYTSLFTATPEWLYTGQDFIQMLITIIILIGIFLITWLMVKVYYKWKMRKDRYELIIKEIKE
jgi:hypothetical protein